MDSKVCATCGRVYQNIEDFLTETFQWRRCSASNLWFNCRCGSTLMIPKGKYSWYNPKQFMSTDAQTIFDQLANIDHIPHIPAIVMQIQNLLDDPAADGPKITKLLRQEPMIALEVLALAKDIRNVRDPSNKQEMSLEHAVTYVGNKSLKRVVMAAALKVFKVPTTIFTTEKFWESGSLVGAFTDILIKRLNLHLNADECYLAGYLANIGKLIAAFCYPDKIDTLEKALLDGKTFLPFSTLEKKMNIGFDHCILGEIGASMWGLPAIVVDCCRYHHKSPLTGQKLRVQCKPHEVVNFAVNLSHWALLEPSRMHESDFWILAENFELSEPEIQDIIDTTVARLKHAKS